MILKCTNIFIWNKRKIICILMIIIFKNCNQRMFQKLKINIYLKIKEYSFITFEYFFITKEV